MLNWSGEPARETPLATETRHREISDQFLEQAQQEYRRGDLLQASEKAWGAVAHRISAIERRRGWPTGRHRLTVKHAEDILGELPHPDPYLTLFDAVEHLHVNFYQDHLTANRVLRGIRAARRLVDVLTDIDDAHAGRASFPATNEGTT